MQHLSCGADPSFTTTWLEGHDGVLVSDTQGAVLTALGLDGFEKLSESSTALPVSVVEGDNLRLQPHWIPYFPDFFLVVRVFVPIIGLNWNEMKKRNFFLSKETLLEHIFAFHAFSSICFATFASLE